SANCTPAELPETGNPVETACGFTVSFSPDLLYANHQGRRVFFCLPICKQDFDRDPLSSCLILKATSQAET
ncbi:MAG: hypothetical protein P8Y03_19910, partial [Anaerolineales bacterium]